MEGKGTRKASVQDLVQMAAILIGTSPERISILFAGKVLLPVRTLFECGLRNGSCVGLLVEEVAAEVEERKDPNAEQTETESS